MRSGAVEEPAHRASATVGLWSAVLLAGVLLAYLCSMVGLLLSHPAMWTSLADHVAATSAPWHTYLTLCELAVFVAAPLYLVLTICLHEQSSAAPRFLAAIGVHFAVVMTVLGSINYFVQLGAVRLSIAHGELAGLEQLVQVNTHSAMYALAILGWALFLGLSSAFLSAASRGQGLPRLIRGALLANSVACALGVIGYLFEIVALDLVYVVGMGSAMIVLSFALAARFRHQLRRLGAAGEHRRVDGTGSDSAR